MGIAVSNLVFASGLSVTGLVGGSINTYLSVNMSETFQKENFQEFVSNNQGKFFYNGNEGILENVPQRSFLIFPVESIAGIIKNFVCIQVVTYVFKTFKPLTELLRTQTKFLSEAEYGLAIGLSLGLIKKNKRDILKRRIQKLFSYVNDIFIRKRH